MFDTGGIKIGYMLGLASMLVSDDAMIVDEPAKPVAGSSQHPNDVDVIDGN